MPRRRETEVMQTTLAPDTMRVEQADGTFREYLLDLKLDEKTFPCPLCFGIGSMPFPEFHMATWYQISYPCTCQRGAIVRWRTKQKFFAGQKPGQPRGLNARELQRLWMATAGKDSLVEAAEKLGDEKILTACIDAAAREEATLDF